MAHKTNSKEQFGFRFFFLKATFKATLTPQVRLDSVDKGLLFLITLRRLFPNLSTNIMFLKYYTIQTTCLDARFFNYHDFSTRASVRKLG